MFAVGRVNYLPNSNLLALRAIWILGQNVMLSGPIRGIAEDIQNEDIQNVCQASHNREMRGET